jgi:hypothetical protein
MPRTQAAMPHLDNRPAARVSKDLITLRVWEVIEAGMRIRISCDNCNHESVWTEGFMAGRLARLKGLTMFRLAIRLRCAGCRSNYVRVWRG